MEKYKKYKETYPNKTDAQIIESLAWELSDKVDTIHILLNENEALRKQVVPDFVFDKSVEHVRKTYCDAHLSIPYMLIGDVAELITIITGKEITSDDIQIYRK